MGYTPKYLINIDCCDPMDLRDAVHHYVADTKRIMEWLRVEGEALNRGELHILEVQLYLLQKEVETWKGHKPRKQSPPAFPLFTSDNDGKKR